MLKDAVTQLDSLAFSYKDQCYIPQKTRDTAVTHYNFVGNQVCKDSEKVAIQEKLFDKAEVQSVHEEIFEELEPTGDWRGMGEDFPVDLEVIRKHDLSAINPRKLVQDCRITFTRRAIQTPCPSVWSECVQISRCKRTVKHLNITRWDIFNIYRNEALNSLAESNAKGPLKSSSESVRLKTLDSQFASMPLSEKYEDDEIEEFTIKKDREAIVNQLQLIERVSYMNLYRDIFEDFSFYECPVDEVDPKAFSFMPLWCFRGENFGQISITSILWSPHYTNALIATRGAGLKMTKKEGLLTYISFLSPERPVASYPQMQSVMCADIKPDDPNFICVGLNDGNIAVFNLKGETTVPRWKTEFGKNSHRDSVNQIKWLPSAPTCKYTFLSLSGDGTVGRYGVFQDHLVFSTEQELVNHKDCIPGLTPQTCINPYSGKCMEFNPFITHLYLVGTEEGKVFLFSTKFMQHQLLLFDAHESVVTAIKWSPFNRMLFLTGSLDYKIKFWDFSLRSALYYFDAMESVSDISWSVDISTRFYVSTLNASILVYDFFLDMDNHIYKYATKKTHPLTALAIHRQGNVIASGDAAGNVTIYKLSPNLVRSTTRGPDIGSKGQREAEAQRLINIATMTLTPENTKIEFPESLFSLEPNASTASSRGSSENESQ